MDSYRHLSIPDFYQYQPNSMITDVLYVVSPDCGCISDEKFEREILDSITDTNIRSTSRTTRKNKPIAPKKRIQKPILKIF